MKVLYEDIIKFIELKHNVNIKRFCYHLIKIGRPDFLVEFAQEGYGLSRVRKEIDKANKIFDCNMINVLSDICDNIEQEDYINFTEYLSYVYQMERVMFLRN